MRYLITLLILLPTLALAQESPNIVQLDEFKYLVEIPGQSKSIVTKEDVDQAIAAITHNIEKLNTELTTWQAVAASLNNQDYTSVVGAEKVNTTP